MHPRQSWLTPPSSDSCSRRNTYYSSVFVFDVFVAGEGRIGDARDGIVRIRSADALELALVHTVHRYLLEDGVSCGCTYQGGE